MPQAAIMAALVGGSTVAGALGNRSKTTTSTTTPSYTPEQGMMQNLLGGILSYDINDPGKGMEPLKTQAVSGVNKTYDNIGKRLQTTLASRGFERSGANEYGTQDLEI